MKNTSKTIIFFGTDEFSTAILKGLVDADYPIEFIITKPDRKSGRGQKINMPPIKEFANRHNITCLQPEDMSSIYDKIKNSGSEKIGILASFGRIIPQSIIDLFEFGIINIHPSLLPKYRGPTPIESAIKNGDPETGVSLIKLVSQMDAGPIYEQIVYSMSGKETQADLYDTLAKLGSKLLLKNLPNIMQGDAAPFPQDESLKSYCSLLSKKDAWLNTDKLTATQAESTIRSQLVFPKSKVKVADQTIIVLKAHVSEKHEDPISIECVDGKYLVIDKLIAPSGRTVGAQAFYNGYIK